MHNIYFYYICVLYIVYCKVSLDVLKGTNKYNFFLNYYYYNYYKIEILKSKYLKFVLHYLNECTYTLPQHVCICGLVAER